MIFGANTTMLSGPVIPMAEGYDGTCGAALALVESARNDYAIFRALIEADCKEIELRRSGYVNEAEVYSLMESTASGIWNKIKEFFKKLIAKIKGIMHTFGAKISGVFLKNKELAKKYQNEVLRKSNIENLEVKWRKLKNNKTLSVWMNVTSDALDCDKDLKDIDVKWKADLEDRWKELTDNNAESKSEYEEFLLETLWEDDTPSTYTVKEVGGMRQIINVLLEGDKAYKNFEQSITKTTRSLENKVKEFNKEADAKTKAYADAGTDQTKAEAAKKEQEKAIHTYDMALVLQDRVLTAQTVSLNSFKICIAQARAAFMKAIAANNDKLAEATYLDAVAEAAEQEVEDVISGALSKEELSKICNASRDIIDGDVSSDPDELTYDPDYYTDNSYVRTAGTVDSDITSRNESAAFGKLFY